MTGRRRKARRDLEPPAAAAPEVPALTRPRSAFLRTLLLAVPLGGIGFMVYRALSGRAPLAVTPAEPGRLDSDLDRSIESHIRAIESDPSAENHGALGLLYEANSLWREAERCFQVAAKLAPDEALWTLHQGIATSEMGASDAALALFERAVRQREDLAAGQFRLADALLREGRRAEALEHFQITVDLSPESSEAHTGLGTALLADRQLEAALRSLKQALALDPTYRTAHYQLGLVHRALGQTEDAQREMALGVDATKRYVPDALKEQRSSMKAGYATQLDGAVRLLRRGQIDDGLAVLERLLTQYPDDTNVLNNLAGGLMMKGEMDRALSLLERARALSDDDFATWINLASWALQTERPGQALGFADRAVQLADEMSAAHAARGKALARLKRTDEAYAAITRATKLDARDPELFAQLGVLCSELGRLEEAVMNLTTAARLAPDWLEAQISLCQLHSQMGHLDLARQALENARRIAPTDARIPALTRDIGGAPR